MKKLFCMCLAAAMLLTLCACRRTDTAVPQTPPTVSETVTAGEDTPPESSPGQPADPSGS